MRCKRGENQHKVCARARMRTGPLPERLDGGDGVGHVVLQLVVGGDGVEKRLGSERDLPRDLHLHDVQVVAQLKHTNKNTGQC